MACVHEIVCALFDKFERKKKPEIQVVEPSTKIEPLVVAQDKCVNIMVGCSGSVAGIKLLELIKILKMIQIDDLKADVKMVVTECSTHFLPLSDLKRYVQVFTNEDEWNSWQTMGDQVLHIELRKWADLFVIAPCSANTMAKIANGICDNLLTCIVRAWNPEKPLLFSPAMNTCMWNHPVTSMHTTLLQSWGYHEIPCVSKRLACGEIGIGGMASIQTIVTHVTQALLNNMDKTTKFENPPKVDQHKSIFLESEEFPIDDSEDRTKDNNRIVFENSLNLMRNLRFSFTVDEDSASDDENCGADDENCGADDENCGADDENCGTDPEKNATND